MGGCARAYLSMWCISAGACVRARVRAYSHRCVHRSYPYTHLFLGFETISQDAYSTLNSALKTIELRPRLIKAPLSLPAHLLSKPSYHYRHYTLCIIIIIFKCSAESRRETGAAVNKSIIGDELHNNTGIMPFSHKTGEGAELEKVPRL